MKPLFKTQPSSQFLAATLVSLGLASSAAWADGDLKLMHGQIKAMPSASLGGLLVELELPT